MSSVPSQLLKSYISALNYRHNSKWQHPLLRIPLLKPLTHLQPESLICGGLLHGNYRPGKTIRVESKRPKSPPAATRIGLFGGPGVGKSALINSFLYVTGDVWAHHAPEAFQTSGTFTMKKEPYDLTEYLTVCDNRGLQDFGGKYMTEVGHQLGKFQG